MTRGPEGTFLSCLTIPHEGNDTSFADTLMNISSTNQAGALGLEILQEIPSEKLTQTKDSHGDEMVYLPIFTVVDFYGFHVPHRDPKKNEHGTLKKKWFGREVSFQL